jgi:hypothetical protein
MAAFSIDARIKFAPGTDISLNGPTGSVSADVFGGPIARLQVALFDANDQVLQAVGFGKFGQSLTTEHGGRASWLFQADSKAAYIKWGIQAVRSAANLGSYSVTVKVRDSQGNALATSQFSATIPDGQFADDIIYDGVNFAQGLQAIPTGTQA